MQGSTRLSAVLLAGVLASSGCYGPFYLTRKVWHWNGQVGGKWANEVAFIAMTWLPVYGIATLADAVIFNSIEFWTGNNPIADMAKDGVQTKMIARGDAEARISRISGADGEQLVIEQFKAGQPAGTLHIQQKDGVTVGADADGNMLFSAKTDADGNIQISNAQGVQVAKYTANDVERLHKVATR